METRTVDYGMPGGELTVEGRRVQRLRNICVTIAVLALFVSWIGEMVRTWTSRGFFTSVFVTLGVTVVLAIIAVACFVVYRMGRFGLLVVVPGFFLLAAAFGWTTAALLTVSLLASAIAALIQPRSAERYFPVDPALLADRVIGEPGEDLTAVIEKFGLDNVSKGIAGEQLTSDLFEERMAEFAPVQLVNGLRFPGSRSADVDHAVVYGSKVALLDSKYWSGNDFYWQGDNVIMSGRGHSLTPREMTFPVAVEALREDLAVHGKQVRGWVVIHSNTDQEILVEPTPEGLPKLVAGDEWFDAVMGWLTAEQPTPRSEDELGLHCDTVKAVLLHKKTGAGPTGR